MDIGYIDFEPIIKNGGFNGYSSGTIVPDPEPEGGCNGKTVNQIANEEIQEL